MKRPRRGKVEQPGCLGGLNMDDSRGRGVPPVMG